MKKIFAGLICLFLFAAAGYAQTTRSYNAVITTGAQTAINLKGSGVYYHYLTWTGSGTRTTCTIKVEQSVDNSSWSDLIAGQTCTSDGSATASGWANYVRVNVTVLTGASNTINAKYRGEVHPDSAIDSAEGAAAGTTPALIGYQANTAEATAVDSADAVKARATLTGIPLSWGPAQPGDTWEYSALIEDTTWTALKALEATYFMCVTAIYVQNSDATVATVFSVYDDEDGDIGGANLKWSGYASALGGGGRMGDGTAPIFCSSAVNRTLYFVAATTSSECRVTAKGFRTKLAPVY